MTKEQEDALNHLKRLVACKIYPDDVNAMLVAIQAIKDLDKMNGIALDLASENDDLIEKLDAIRAEIEQAADKQFEIAMGVADLNERYTHIQMESAYRHSLNIIDKYRKGDEI